MKIGFIGLGIMGKPMAANILAAGFPLALWARQKVSLKPLVNKGARAFASAAELAANVDIIISMVADSSDVGEVMLGEKGVIKGAKKGMLAIDMSTILPQTAREIGKAFTANNLDFLDAPVSGGEAGAKSATLSIMVGGTKKAFQKALPVFNVLGKNIVHIGDSGTGQIAKAANQIITGVSLVMIAEALNFATQSGAEAEKVREALLGGSAYSKILENHGARMLAKNFTPGFKSWMHQKDLNIALANAHQLGICLPTSAAAAQIFNAMQGQKMGEQDSVAVIKILQQLSGVKND